MARNIEGWIIRNHRVFPIRVKNGTIIIMHDNLPQHDWGLRDEQPKIFQTEDAARNALEHIQAYCVHSWRILSHEERECKKCGMVEFIPDWD